MKTHEEQALDRRSFLRRAAVLGAGVIGMGSVACSQQPSANDQRTAGNATDDTNDSDRDIDILETFDSDIVVIGSGSTGTAAALRGAELGARVIMIEQLSESFYGGSSALTSGVFGLGTTVQKELGIATKTVEEYFLYANNYHKGSFNSRVFKNFLMQSAPTVEWLLSLGVEFATVVLDVFHIYKTESGKTKEALEFLYEKGKAFNVQYEFDTTALKILFDGKVTGLVARREDGAGIQINAPVVIIATGGYAGNEEMLVQFTNYGTSPFIDSGIPGRRGDGIRMATEIGAALHHPEALNTGQLVMKGGGTLGSELGSMPIARPESVLINQNGVRFMSESFGNDQAFSLNPSALQNQTINILDQAAVDTMISTGILGWDLSYVTFPDLQEQIDSEISKGNAFKADSYSELANLLSIDSQMLKETMDDYNSYCAAGLDADFYKTPEALVPLTTGPFYALLLQQSLMNTVGGLKVDENARVIDAEGKPIPGLYAGGSDAGAIFGFNYDIDGLPSSMQGWCSTSGKLAAEDAVNAYIAL
ncbi:MAG: FAD-binding protein [Coriobacteriales bacterium]|jgi:fumarate reductase flavoprotein subunit|nr:FAD-binding protein [Coriobacteriales bacterium]